MKIPYGMSNFANVRKGGFFYVDKTPFLPRLESAEHGLHYLLLLRPRRMGKSLLLSLLEYYYDIARRDQFDALFSGLWIHDRPTPEKNRYLVLPLDFSAVQSDGTQETLQRSFLDSVRSRIFRLVRRYRARIPELAWLLERLDTYQDAAALLEMLMGAVEGTGHPLYILIDEYDTFANALLTAGQDDLYSAVVERTGFVRAFYRALKAGTQSGVLQRLFVTGVSPILLDDLSSGFNIITNVSGMADFNALAGFSHADVKRAITELLTDQPQIAVKDRRLADPATLLAQLEGWYNGYRFSIETDERVFNSDMVLYFFRELVNRKQFPTQLLDPNVRTDYSRLQRLGMLTGTAAAARRELLQTVLDQGWIDSPLMEQFGARSLSSEAQYLSLLYYLGMLTLSPQPAAELADDPALVRLEIPNRVIRELQWSHLALMLKDQEASTSIPAFSKPRSAAWPIGAQAVNFRQHDA